VIGAFGNTSDINSASIFNPPHPGLPNEIVNAGYTWEYDAPEMGGKFTWSVESVSETVQVPAGNFNDCIKLKLTITNESGEITQWGDLYLAEGVGEVLNKGSIQDVINFELKLTEYSVQTSND